ncbi:hypothetical protein FHS42_000993 [Streptomyces zagrosensis]|uniref:Uncharacterized protein n=1 Tax=Streptomyces zagrosensis TaxID=1042984 RepID=A0A7W9Q7H8_9ACTN|nr:hypothetical protein [Streptomyces zagrosensis]
MGRTRSRGAVAASRISARIVSLTALARSTREYRLGAVPIPKTGVRLMRRGPSRARSLPSRNGGGLGAEIAVEVTAEVTAEGRARAGARAGPNSGVDTLHALSPEPHYHFLGHTRSPGRASPPCTSPTSQLSPPTFAQPPLRASLCVAGSAFSPPGGFPKAASRSVNLAFPDVNGAYSYVNNSLQRADNRLVTRPYLTPPEPRYGRRHGRPRRGTRVRSGGRCG